MQGAVRWWLHHAGCCKISGQEDVTWGTRSGWHQLLEAHESNANLSALEIMSTGSYPSFLDNSQRKGHSDQGAARERNPLGAEEARASGALPLPRTNTFSVLQTQTNPWMGVFLSLYSRFWYLVATYFNSQSLAEQCHLPAIFLIFTQITLLFYVLWVLCISGNALSFFCSWPVLVWVAPKADPEAGIWLQVVYLGDDSRSATREGGLRERREGSKGVHMSRLLVSQSCWKCAPLSDREAGVSLHRLQFTGWRLLLKALKLPCMHHAGWENSLSAKKVSRQRGQQRGVDGPGWTTAAVNPGAGWDDMDWGTRRFYYALWDYFAKGKMSKHREKQQQQPPLASRWKE